MISKPYSIHSDEAEIDLEKGSYKICILGGWNVHLGDFSIRLVGEKPNEIYNAKSARWPVQSHTYHQKSKRIFRVKVPQKGKYLIVFKHAENVAVKPSNLFLRSLFQRNIDNRKLEIFFTTIRFK